jgi:hypothetical protein
MKKSFLFLAVSLLALPVTARAQDYWNGHECIECPSSPFETGPGKDPAPIVTGGGSGPLAELPAVLPDPSADSLRAPDEPYLADLKDGSFLYFIEGSVKSVQPRSNLLIVQNRRTRRNQAVYVVDPLLNELRERNLVEIWLKPGSDRAERIRRLS